MKKLSFFPEQKLINRIKSNDRAVLAELFVRYEKMIASYVTKNGGDDFDAKDMLQEAIIVLWQNVCSGKFELKSKLSTYVMAVAKNKWNEEKRKRSRNSGEIPESIADGQSSILDSVINEEKMISVKRALETLQSPCKELLMLFYFEERSLRDIARILGFANADVVKSKKYQCKKSLEMILARQMNVVRRRTG